MNTIIKKEINDQIFYKVDSQVCKLVWYKSKERVWNQVDNQVIDNVNDQVWDQVNEQINNRVAGLIREEMWENE